MPHEIGPTVGFLFSENVGFLVQLPVITPESGRSEVVVGATSLAGLRHVCMLDFGATPRE